jgi:L,D-peptidoglycan transpeptidase YkuD (ErfK/YbiS/YcfS/YnhG family)
VTFAGQPAQPFRAQTGYGGLLPISARVPGDWATPTGLFPFGTTVYGNSPVSPTTHYPYHHLVCGDWWDELPGSPTYDTFEHVPCGSTPAYGDDSEALWTEIQPYQHFIDIKMPSPPDNGAGIFLHDDMAVGYTEGCVALPNAELDAVLGWLNAAESPHILIGVG